MPAPFVRKRIGKSLVIFEIIILAMIAAFLGLRLYSVLGRRAEHEEEIISTRFEPKQPPQQPQQEQQHPVPPFEQPRPERAITGFPPAIEAGLRDIAAADRQFELLGFMEGARSAYGIVLEAFWEADRETLRELCDDDVYASFDAAITAREKAGETLENRLIRIEESRIHSASLDGKTARIAVEFVADIAALTRDKDGTMIAGSLDDAVVSRDVWTFSRAVNGSQPGWLLDETDQA